MNNDLMKTKYELVVEEIEKIDKGLVWKYHDFLGDYRDVTLDNAIKAYSELRNTIDYIPGLSDDEKLRLRELLDVRIKEAPEKDKKEKQILSEKSEQRYEKIAEEKKQAWEKAKERYASQSIFKKIRDTFSRNRPRDIENTRISTDMTRLEGMSFDRINRLYGGDHDR